MASQIVDKSESPYHEINIAHMSCEEMRHGSVSSEDETLLHVPLNMKYRRRRPGFIGYIQEPCIAFLVGGILFSILLVIGITTLAIVQQSAASYPQSNRINHHDSKSKSVLRNENGLRITSDGKLLECGETAKAAAENGCVFDAFAFSYIPPACFEQDLMEEALSPDSYLAPWAAGDFPWYKWSNFTEPVPQTSEALSQHTNLWTNNAWHKAHCLYEWRLITRALHRQATGVRPVYVLKRALEVAHVNHCNQMVSDPLTEDASPIWAMRNVGRCIRVDEDEDDWEEPELHF